MKKILTKLVLALWVLAFIPLSGLKAQTLLVTGDGPVAPHNRIPVFGYWFEKKQKSQIIYPASKLTDLQGKKITKLTLFTNQGNNDNWENEVHVRMACTTQDDLDAGWFTEATTEVFIGLFVINSNNELVIELATPFLYTGDNLLIEYDVPTTTSTAYADVSFYGTSEASSISRHAYNGGYTGAGTAYGFLPKMLVEYFDESCPAITNLNAIVNPNNTAMLTWTTPGTSFWPTGATYLTFKFFNGNTQIGESYYDHTSWTSDVLPVGTNTLGASISYYNNNSELICVSGISQKTVTIPCPAASDLTATIVNENDVKLTWETPKILTEILSEDFESGMPAGWTFYDEDHDGQEWTIGWQDGSVIYSQSQGLSPDNYLVTPLVEGATHLQYWVRSDISAPNEKYAIMISTTGKNVSDFTTLVHQETLTANPNWQQKSFDLPAGTKYIAFRHFDCPDQYMLYIDNISVYGNAAPITDDLTYTIYRRINGGGVKNEIASGITDTTYTDTGLNGNIYEYCVEVVYENCSSSQICENIAVPDVPRPPVNNLVATVDGYDVTLTWEAPSNVLLIEGFESATFPPTGWILANKEATPDGHDWYHETTLGQNSEKCAASTSYDGAPLTPDNLLITPLVTGITKVEYWVRACNEKHSVMYTTASAPLASNFHYTADEETIDVCGTWLKRTIDIESGTKYIAFRHFENGNNSYVNIDNVVVYGSETFAGNYTYTIYKDGYEIASGLTELTFTDTDLSPDIYEYSVEVVYNNATSDTVSIEAIIHDVARPPVRNLSATASTNNVNLTWDVPVKALLIENFEGNTLPTGWTTIDKNDDGESWTLNTEFGYNSHNSMHIYSSNLSNDYLITPLVEGATSIEYWANGWGSSAYYMIMVSKTGNTFSDFTDTVFKETIDLSVWHKRHIDLPEGTKYIAFRYLSQFEYFNIDNVVVYGSEPVTDDYTYTIDRNGEEIASGIEKTNTTYSDQSLVAGLYDYCVKVVYENAISDPVCTSIEAAGALIMYYDTVGNRIETFYSPLTVAIRLTNDELATYYNNYKITQVRYYIRNIDETDVTIKIYGNGTASAPGELLRNEPASPTQNGWNIHTLTDPLLITSGDYWVGCEIEGNTYIYVGIDEGPAVAGKGDWIYYSGTWDELVNVSYLNNNWNIRALLAPAIDVCPQVIALDATLNIDNTITLEWTNPGQAMMPSGATMLTFNFFDGGTQIGNSFETINTWTTTELEPGTHSLGVQIVYWENDITDICYSTTSYVSIDVPEPPACPQVNNFSASVNGNNVNLSWEAPDALPTVLLSESFESGIPSEWTLIDADGDNHKWTASNSYTAHSGNSVAASFSKRFANPLTPDNYLITPLVEGATSIKYYFTVDATNPAEHYALMASTTGTDADDFELVFEETATGTPTGWIEREKELPEGTKYVAFRHYNCTNQSYILLDDITVYGESTSNYTYTITKDDVEIETGYTETTYTDLDVDFGTYNYCVKAVYEGCIPEPVCETVTLQEITCPPVENLSATVNTDNTVELSWDIPASTEFPSGCNGDLGFSFYNGYTQIGGGAGDVTSWTTGVLPNGTHTLKVVIYYYDDESTEICSAEATETVTISGSFDCPPVEDLSATVNAVNHTVALSWTLPTELPTDCNGNLDFWFYDGSTAIGVDFTDDLTSWTTPALSVGTHTLAVIVRYYDFEGAEICSAEATVTVTIEEITCSAVKNLTAATNTDNTVTLSWDIPESSEWPNACNGDLGFKFYNGSTLIGESATDDLTSWTTAVLPNGTYTLKVVIYYYDDADAEICSAGATKTVTISGSFTCPPVNNLTATANTDNTVDLNWTIPTELPTDCNGNLDFKFYDGNTEIGSDSTDNLTSWTTPALSDGTHTLAVVVYYYDDADAEICFAEASITVTTDVEEIKSSIFSAEIYPNPANDVLNIVSDSEIISYELYDALGRLLINKSEVSNTESTINVSSLNNGMYILKLHTANGSGMFKIIKN